ncbi:MAG: hypothetical protein KGJ50_12750 [Xanthomonadaceae bacterium]|nr:hypothetical protein [Xanthomonadaceae bacterium]
MVDIRDDLRSTGSCRMSFRTLLCVAIAAALTGCATQEPFVHPLAASEARALRQPAIYIAIPQKKLEAQYLWATAPQPQSVYPVQVPAPASGPAPSAGTMLAAGLVAGLVVYGLQQHDKHEAIDAEQKYLVTVQHSLQGYDPRAAIEQQLAASLRQQPWGQGSVVHVVAKLPQSDAGKGDNAQIYVDYALSPDFSELVMRATVAISHQTRTSGGGSAHTVVYRNRLIYLSDPAVLPAKTAADKQHLYARAMDHWDAKAVDAEIARLNREGADENNGEARHRMQEKLRVHNLAVRDALADQWTGVQAMRFRTAYWAANDAQPIRQAIARGTRTLAELLAKGLRAAQPVAGQAPAVAGHAGHLGTLPDGEIITDTAYGVVAHDSKAGISPFVWAYPVTP